MLALVAVICTFAAPETAQAGPLLDWLFGRRAAPAYPVGPAIPVGQPYANGYAAGYSPYPSAYGVYGNPAYGYGQQGYGVPSYASRYGNYAVPPNGLPNTMSYVPNYSSYAYRAPVTYYRPLLTTDPTTGSQVVAMAPCTSYEYQTQRVPAFGQTALYGSYPAQPIAPAVNVPQSYTLPNGGIPLAYATPSTLPGTASGYGSYSTLQPSAGNYGTAPLGQPYYGGTTGGSCGTIPSTVPGLVAPQAPSSYQSQPLGIDPNDPANRQPVLPLDSTMSTSSVSPSPLKPQLRGVYLEPREQETASSSERRRVSSESIVPDMRPIPAPADFDAAEPWVPPLLRDSDLTAQAAPKPSPVNEFAGQSKTIQWASFTQSTAPEPTQLSPRQNLRPAYQPYPREDRDELSSARDLSYRAPRVDTNPVQDVAAPRQHAPEQQQTRRRATGGWSASR